MNKRKDIVWIDYSRMIGIWLVILGHSIQRIRGWETTLLGTTGEYIYLFHMPLFFVISGYLYRSEKQDNFRMGGGKIWHALVIPYFIYQLAFLPYTIFVHREELSEIGNWLKLTIGFIGGDGYETPISYYFCLPCWFIVCIIQLRVIFLFVKIDKVSSVVLSVVSIVFFP